MPRRRIRFEMRIWVLGGGLAGRSRRKWPVANLHNHEVGCWCGVCDFKVTLSVPLWSLRNFEVYSAAPLRRTWFCMAAEVMSLWSLNFPKCSSLRHGVALGFCSIRPRQHFGHLVSGYDLCCVAWMHLCLDSRLRDLAGQAWRSGTGWREVVWRLGTISGNLAESTNPPPAPGGSSVAVGVEERPRRARPASLHARCRRSPALLMAPSPPRSTTRRALTPSP